jgi:hypothetical protein
MKQPLTALEQALSAAQRATGSREDVAQLRSRLEAALAAELPPSGPAPANKTSPLSAARIWLVSGALLIAVGGWLGSRGPTHVHKAHSISIEARLPAAEPVPQIVEPTAPEQVQPPTAAEIRVTPAATPRREPKRPKAATLPAISEVQLISQAQAALERDPRASLGWLSQHEQLYSRGLLSEERDILRFDAERTLGLEQRASAHAAAFMSAYPSSPHRRRVEQWLIEQSQQRGSAATHR